MPIDVRPPGRCLLTLVLLLIATALTAQTPHVRFDPATQVGRISYRFTGSQSLREDDLQKTISLTASGSWRGVRDALDFIPFVEPVGEHPFDPLELQRDVVRLRRVFAQAGFLGAVITYEVVRDEPDNVVDIEFIIDEGPPLILTELQVLDPEGTLPSDAAGFLPRMNERLNLFDIPALDMNVTRLLMERGFAVAEVQSNVRIDSTAHTASLAVRVNAGPLIRVAAITTKGAESVGEYVVTRELPFKQGDPVILSELSEGRREILSLGFFRGATVGPAIRAGSSDSATIPVTVTEGPPRQIGGEAGYDSRGGLTMQVEWLHRNFTGECRTFSVSGLAQTGILALETTPEVLYRAGFTLTQPYVFHRRLSLLASPYIEHRNDYRDRSDAYGASATLIYQVNPIRSLALRYAISDRRIEEARFGEFTSGSIDLLTLLNTLAKGDRVLKSTVGIQASFGSLDDITVPRAGYLLRPAAEVTVFPSLNSVEYVMGNLSAYGFLPFSEGVALAARALGGVILPFGKGLPTDDQSAAVKFLQLRDVVFTAGGTEDVRAWGSRLLGPKFPDLRVNATESDTTTTVLGYVPIGGLARLAFSIEVRFPFPGLGQAAGLSVFFDGARLWNDQITFEGWPDEEQFFFGTGIGFLYRLPVGTFRLDTGYKINPSFQDLREPEDIVNALTNGTPVEDVPTSQWKRLHLHFSIAVSF